MRPEDLLFFLENDRTWRELADKPSTPEQPMTPQQVSYLVTCLMLHHRDAVLGALIRKRARRAEAEDIFSEVLLKVVRALAGQSLAELDEKIPLDHWRAYLCKAAVRAFFDRGRKTRREKPLTDFETEEDDRSATRLLDRLSEDERGTVLERIFRERKWEQVERAVEHIRETASPQARRSLDRNLAILRDDLAALRRDGVRPSFKEMRERHEVPSAARLSQIRSRNDELLLEALSDGEA